MTVTSNIHVGLTAWATGQSYSLGTRVSNSSKAYQCVQGGTSGSAPGPTTTGSGITDGSCKWNYLSAIDYTTIQAWADAIPATRTTNYIGLLWNDGEITTTIVSGFGVPFVHFQGHGGGSSSNTITLTTAPGESFNDTAGPLAYSGSRGVGLRFPSSGAGNVNYIWIDDDWVIIDGIQTIDPNPASACTHYGGAGNNVVLQNVLMDGAAQGGGANIVQLAGNNAIMRNCVAFDREGAIGTPTTQFTGNTPVVVNNTFVFVTYAANCRCLDIATGTTGTARNNIFINYDIPFSSGGGTQWATDHNGYTAASFVISNDGTTSGGDVFSLVPANEFVSVSSDVRLRFGARCADAGATDSTHVPSSADIFGTARPQATAWDIGAFELIPPQQLGTARARGRATPAGQSAPARGRAAGRGKAAALTASVGVSAAGKASGRGLGAATLVVSLPTSLGTARGRGQIGAGLYALPIPQSRGAAASRGAGTPARSAFLASRSIGASRGAVPLIATRAFAGHGSAAGSGAILFQALAVSLAGAGGAGSRGRGGIVAGLMGASRGTGRGKATVAAKAVLASRAQSGGHGALGAPALGVSARGKAQSRGRGAAEGANVLVATGFAAARGTALEGAFEILAGAGAAASTGAFGPFAGTLTMAAAGRGIGQGLTNDVAAKPVAARGFGRSWGTQGTFIVQASGTARSFGRSNSVASRPLAAAGSAAARGRTVPLNSYAAAGRAASRGSGMIRGTITLPAAAGDGAASGAAAMAANAVVAARGEAAGAGSIPASLTFFGLGAAVGHSRANALARLMLRGIGIAAAEGAATIGAATALGAAGHGSGDGVLGGSFAALMASAGSAAAAGAGVFTKFGIMASRSVASARGAAGGAYTAIVAARGNGAARGLAPPVAGLGATGRATGIGRVIGGPSAALASLSRATARGAAGIVGMFFVAARGGAQAKANLYGRADLAGRGDGAAQARSGLGVQLYPGRGNAAAHGRGFITPLTGVFGAGHAASRGMAAAPVLSFTASGRAQSSGKFFRIVQMAGSGFAEASGRSLVSPWYFTAPDESAAPAGEGTTFGPASTLDVDTYVFDWTTLASIVNDPIVSAVVTASPAGLTIGAVEVLTTQVAVTLGPAAQPDTYGVRCSVTLRSGRSLHRTIPLFIEVM